MRGNVNRRNFLKTLAAVGAAALFAKLLHKKITHQSHPSQEIQISETDSSAVADYKGSPYLRFNYCKPQGEFSYDEFMQIGRELEKVVSEATGSTVHSKILTCEDNLTYLASYMSRPSDAVRAALENRKHYSVDEMTQNIWDKSQKVNLIMDLPRALTPFMISVVYDPTSGNKLSFYGQCLDDRTQIAMTRKFGPQAQY